MSTPAKIRRIGAVVAAALVVYAAGSGAAHPVSPATHPAIVPSNLAIAGCPRAHCDGQNSDLARLAVPPAGAAEVWHSTEGPGEQAGSRQGLGCSANGMVAVCTYSGSSDNLVAYDYDGTILWTSRTVLNAYAYTSAPLVLQDGSVIACDSEIIVRFDATGQIVWQSPLVEGGIPVSPVTTDDGSMVAVGTYGGPIYTWHMDSGELAGLLYVRASPGDPGFFETVNTPAVRGNRLYVLSHHQVAGVPDADGLSRIVAIDVIAGAVSVEQRLRVAWHYDFGGPSRASPLLIGPDILFDADRPGIGMAKAPQLLAVRDLGGAPALRWQRPAGGLVMASYARDPRPGGTFWMYTLFSPWLVRRTAATGAVVQAVNLDALIGEAGTHVPLSALTIGGTAGEPVLMASATAFGSGATYVTAIDLVSGLLRWNVPVADIGGWYTAGQFPLVARGDGTRVVFTTYNSGARAIGLPF